MNNSKFYTPLLTNLLSHYISHPEVLSVTEEAQDHLCSIYVKGHRADQGVLVGTKGANVKALQLLTGEIGRQRGETVSLQIVEPFPGIATPKPPFVSRSTWNIRDDAKIEKLLDTVLSAVFGERNYGLANACDNDSEKTRFIVETPDVTLAIEGALNTIFRAIGKAQGRIISVDCRQSNGA